MNIVDHDNCLWVEEDKGPLGCCNLLLTIKKWKDMIDNSPPVWLVGYQSSNGEIHYQQVRGCKTA